MAAGVSHLTQSWPPPPGAYDYVLTLNDEEIAWEGLRRNAGYQRHYRLNAAGHARSRRLTTGQSIWRVASLPSGCERVQKFFNEVGPRWGRRKEAAAARVSGPTSSR